MIIIGCDFHPSWQQVCWLDIETGELVQQTVLHVPGEVEKFYRQFAAPALIGMESTGNCQWFVELLERLGHVVWIGDAAKIRASDVRQQKHDRRDAELLWRLLHEDRFPRIWTPSSEQRDARQLLIHRHKLVRVRAQVKNEPGRAEEAAVDVERSGTASAARTSAGDLGQPAAGRSVEVAVDAGRADRIVGPGGESSG